MFYLGIDVSKAKLDCLLLDSSTDKRKSKVVNNSPEGYSALFTWLAKQQAADVHVIMEPTGIYHEAAAFALVNAGVALSLVNPAQLRRFAQGIGVKNKTDAADSNVLARYGASQKPPLWEPPSAEARTLHALLIRRDAIANDLQREKNRAEKTSLTLLPDFVQSSLDASIAFLTNELDKIDQAINQHIDQHPHLRDKRTLLTSIPGIGERVANQMTDLFSSHQFSTAEQAAAYLGLVPTQWQSGSSVRGKSRLSKAGPPRLRQLLYMPAIVAIRYNPHIKALYQRLTEQGKSKMSALGAAMRKLVHLSFGVLKSGKPYDENWKYAS